MHICAEIDLHFSFDFSVNAVYNVYMRSYHKNDKK